MRSFKLVLLAAAMCCFAGTAYFAGQQDQAKTTAADALKKADVTGRLLERTASHVPKTGTAPSFVVDPAWPKPLPHNWIIGDVGGLFVDRHDHIWVYHRPRALVSSDAGALGSAGEDAKGNALSALGHPPPYGRLSACCVSAPSVIAFYQIHSFIYD